MRPHHHTASQFRSFIAEHGDTDVMRVQYCYQIGSAFVSLARMEDAIIAAIATCDGIKIAKLLGPDAPSWKAMLQRLRVAQDSTLGAMVQLLSKHGILDADLRYLRWVKEKRDIFIHRLFRDGGWPGELSATDCQVLIRRLRYLEIVFARASDRIWHIFARANLLDLTPIDGGAGGYLAENPGALAKIFGG